jgi:lipoprotein-anchoring transpeptidase ErfK/SrfK
VDTLKTAVVVVLLLAVLYGVYVVLNKPGEPFPEPAAWQQPPMEPLQIDVGGFDSDSSFGATPSPSLPTAQVASPRDSVGEIQPTQPTTSHPSVAAPEFLAGRAPPEPPTQQPPTPSFERGIPDRTVNAHDAGGGSIEPPPPMEAGQLATSQPYGAASNVTPKADSLAGAVPALEAPTSLPPDPSILPETPSAEGAGFDQLQNLLQTVQTKVQNEQWYDALWSLSLFYDSPDITLTQRQLLHDWLDPLAARVIYSREHLIEQAYEVQSGDTLPAIAERYGVPWKLLANINSLQTADALPSGTQIKVLRGPLRAEVHLARNEITVFAGKLYAGRFPITVGSEPAPAPGQYRVLDKQTGRTYYAGDGKTIPPGDSSNPYGTAWIDLGEELCIHGSPPSGAAADAEGCIRLSSLDAGDLLGILSKGSTVNIRR